MQSNEEAEAVLWAVLEKAAEKKGRRDPLRAGQSYPVRLTVSGEIAGREVSWPIAGTLAVGHPGVRAQTSSPTAAALAAYFLGCLSARHREAILRKLPALFAKLGGLPEAPPAVVEMAQSLCKQLRSTGEPQATKPPVSFLAETPS